MRIAAIETRRYRCRGTRRCASRGTRAAHRPGGDDRDRRAPTTGVEGYASGDALPDRELLERLLVGVDPLRTEIVREVCETVDFHDGRPWTARGARSGTSSAARSASRAGSCSAAAPSGCSRTHRAASGSRPDERARRCVALRDAGVRAVKLRFHHEDWRADVEVVAAVRDAVGAGHADHGRREPGLADAGRPRARAGTSRRPRSARASSSALGVYWLEEPLRTDDLDGYAALRRLTDLRLAAGEMVRDGGARRATSSCAAAST